jgi:Concanavalin A-like lectin/glucanases superfamily/Immunoglobulin I-set domain
MKKTIQLFTLLAISATSLFLAGTASAASPIGLHFLTQNNVGNTNGAALAATDLAGASIYAQTNWNNLASTTALGTNVALIDSSGAATTVAVSWSAPNTWSQSGNTTINEGSPDANLMNPYLDNNGNANVAITNPFNMFSTTTPVNANRNWPLAYLTGLQAWMTAQGVAAYDVVIYFDGDANSGRTGEYWPVNASGTPDALTLGADVSTHIFGCDLNNFVSNPLYTGVSSSILTGSALPNVSGGLVAEYGNFPGNYLVFTSLTNDTVLFRTQRFNSRAPINAVQVIPRATVLPATIYPLFAAPVYAGGKARFAPTVAGGTPMTFQWLKNGVPLTDGGNIYGSATAALIVSNVSAGDVTSYSLVVTNPLGVITSSPAALTIVTPVVGSYPEKIATNLPYAYWRFNENADTSTGFTPAYDYVGGFTATYGIFAQNAFSGIVGPVPTDYPGFESGNTAYQSSKISRQTYLIAQPLLLNTNTVTMCAWIYPTAAQSGATAILASRGAANDVGVFGYNANNNIGYTWNSNSSATYNYVSGLVPLTNSWNFVAMTITPTNAILYCYNTNSQFSATNAIAHTVQSFTGPTFIGGDPQGSSIAAPSGRSFVGSIDELAVYNRALPQTEIYNLFKKGLGLTAIGPNIPVSPQSLALFEGRTANFNITASGDAPLTFLWRKNGVNMSNGANTNGATTPSLTISNVTIAGDAANYDVVVANIVGSITSSVANLSIVLSNSAPTPYEAKLRSLNPISYWRLNEANTSPYSFDYWGGVIATNENNVILGVAGPQPPDFSGLETTNTAGQYDGATADTATSASIMNNRSAFSIIGWFNAAAIQPQRTGLFGQNDVCEFGFHGLGSDGLAQLGIFTPSASAFLAQSNIIAGVWYLVAAVGTGTNVNLYLASTNGAGGLLVLQSTTSSATTTNYGSSIYPFRIGGGGILDPTGNYFNGVIDEVAVFSRALSVGELSDLFGAALTGGDLAPSISGNPSSLTLYAGLNATFSVNAVGTSPQFQWRTNGVPVADNGNLSGSTTPTLTITNITGANALSYDVVVSNHVNSVTSIVATLTVIVPDPGSYAASVIGLKPLAYYRLNETNDPSTGTLVNPDFYGGHNGVYGAAAQNGFNGILGPQPPLFTFETNNTAIETFPNVASSWATAPFGSLSTNTVTMTMWVNPAGDQIGFAGLLINRNSGIAGGFGYGNGNQLDYTWNNNNANTYNFVSGLVPPANQWSFVAMVIQPTQAVLYLMNASGQFSATNVVAHTSDVFGNNWEIGNDDNSANNNGSRTFTGLIDEVAVFNYSLTPAQLTTLFSAGSPQPVTLTIQPSGANVIVTWPKGTLLEANDLLGPWTTNNAVSPYTVAPTATKKFYRVQVQ